MSKDESEKLNIYPPEFPDPLLPPTPGVESEGAAKDAYLGELAKDNLAAAEEAGVPPDNAPLAPDAPTSPPPAPLTPTGALLQVTLGAINPATPVAGAAVSFCARVGNWRDAVALRVSGVDEADGNVLLDLEWGDHNAVTAVRYGDGVRCWRFRAE